MYDEYKAKHEIVFERLRSEILGGLLLPGTKLEAAAIAERLVVSRTPVREALRRLEAAELVMFSPDKGARVAVIPLEEVNEVAIIRVMLEGTAGRLGAKNITSEGLVRLRELLSQMDNSVDRPALWARLHSVFHMTLYEASNQRYLCRLIRQVRDRSQLYINLYVRLPDLSRQAHLEHVAIVDAVERHDADLAQSLIEGHIKNSVAALYAHLRPHSDQTAFQE